MDFSLQCGTRVHMATKKKSGKFVRITCVHCEACRRTSGVMLPELYTSVQRACSI